jgi:outer membrane protein insertion porin family
MHQTTYIKHLITFSAFSIAIFLCSKPLPLIAQNTATFPAANSSPVQQTLPVTSKPAVTQSSTINAESSNPHQEFQGLPVISIEFKGNQFLTAEKLYGTIKTRIDRSFDSAIIKEDVRRLYRTGLIRDVRLLTNTAASGVHLTFEIFERPTINTVRFIGNRMFLDNKLTKQTDLRGGDALDIFAIEDAKRKIEELYHEKGHPKAHVTILEGNKPDQRNVVFYIDEGPREKIAKIEVVGNDPRLATDARLKTQLQAKDKLTNWLYGGDYIPKAIDADVQQLISYYRNLGYFQATAGRQVEYDESGHWVTLRFIVNEGPRYRIGSISIQGNNRVSSPTLQPLLTIQNGDYFNRSELSAMLDSLKEIYGKLGFIYSTVTPDIRFKEVPGELDVVFQIVEGDQFKIGRIDAHISGLNPHTKNAVVLNRLSLIPGYLANNREVKASERRLRFSSLFNSDPSLGTPPSIVIRTDAIDAMRSNETSANPPQPENRHTIRGQSPLTTTPDNHPVNRTSAFPLR